MKKRYIEKKWFRNARPGGGLFLGFQFHFPSTVLLDNGELRSIWRLRVGLVFWTREFLFYGPDVQARYKESNKEEKTCI